jgi:hypothetical protein
MRDEGEDLRRVGRDEMNLCEFPIATLSDRVPEGCRGMVLPPITGIRGTVYRHSGVSGRLPTNEVWFRGDYRPTRYGFTDQRGMVSGRLPTNEV